jgi:hypothetical protein
MRQPEGSRWVLRIRTRLRLNLKKNKNFVSPPTSEKELKLTLRPLGVTSPQKNGSTPTSPSRPPSLGAEITHFNTFPSGRTLPPPTSGRYTTSLPVSLALELIASEIRCPGSKDPFPRNA